MVRYIKPIFVLCAALIILSGCTKKLTMKNVHNEPHFAGVVIETLENSILVSVNEGEDARRSSDLIHVSLNVELKDSIADYMSGDEVIVYYDGMIMETYPAQINKVYAIVLTSPDKKDDWSDLSGVDVLHILSGQQTERSISDERQINELYKWFTGLSLSKQQFGDGESPGDSDGGEVYIFTLIQNNGDEISFTYGKYGLDKNYIFYYEEWYKVNNPSDPFGFDSTINFNAQYIRTDGYVDGTDYPIVTVISSLKELEQYYENYKDIYDFSSRSTAASDMTVGFIDATSKYTDGFFMDNYVVIVLLEEGSGSVRHRVESINENGDIVINRLLPEMGTDDMAEWNIIIELSNDYTPDKFNVVITDNRN